MDVERVTDLSGDAVAALRAWTLTEARAKATGHGLAAPEEHPGPRLRAVALTPDEHHLAALAVPADLATPVVVRWVRLA